MLMAFQISKSRGQQFVADWVNTSFRCLSSLYKYECILGGILLSNHRKGLYQVVYLFFQIYPIFPSVMATRGAKQKLFVASHISLVHVVDDSNFP